MLVLSRKEHQRIVIDGGIVITVVEVRRRRVKIGIEAPPETGIVRGEIEKSENHSE